MTSCRHPRLRRSPLSSGISLSFHQSLVTSHQSLGLSPLECALTSKHRVLQGFARNCLSATPLECALTETRLATPLECALTKKVGGGVRPIFEFRISSFVFDFDSQPPITSHQSRFCPFCPLLSPLLSVKYKLPNLQPLCFDNHATVPGVGRGNGSGSAALVHSLR
jgi:hypothetical protein